MAKAAEGRNPRFGVRLKKGERIRSKGGSERRHPKVRRNWERRGKSDVTRLRGPRKGSLSQSPSLPT